MINCEYQFCIYNSDKCCALDNILISSDGLCSEIITVDIDKSKLDLLKKEKLEDILKRK